MSGAVERTVKSTQEQAIAAWITHLNQMRLDTLIEKLNRQDINLEEALKELEKIKQFIGAYSWKCNNKTWRNSRAHAG